MSVYDLSHIEIWVLVTLIFIFRYLLIAGITFYVLYVWKTDRYQHLKIQKILPGTKQIREEVGYSLLTFLIYGSGIWLFLYWIEHGMTKLYLDIHEYGLGYFVLSIGLMVVLHDTYFYWTHRLIHHPVLFKYIHGVHHRFKSPTPWAAFAFHPLEAITTLGIIPIILFVIPHHQYALILFVTFLTLYNVFIHLGYSTRTLKFSRFQNTPDHHDYHHLKAHGNYGLYFTFWDRIMGTLK